MPSPSLHLPMYRIAPCTVAAARKQVRAWHRHLPELQGGLFGAQIVDSLDRCVAVAVFGNPPRVWQGTGRGVITRCAAQERLPLVGDHAAPACTMLYGALCRAAKALGYREAWTYTLPEEPGTSLRAAGFIDMGLTDGGNGWMSRPNRKVIRPEPKRRWLRRLAAAPSRFAKEMQNSRRELALLPALHALQARLEARS